MKYVHNGVLYDKDAEDIARIFGPHVTTIRAKAKAGKIPHLRLGISYLFNEEQVRHALVKPVAVDSVSEDYSDLDDI